MSKCADFSRWLGTSPRAPTLATLAALVTTLGAAVAVNWAVLDVTRSVPALTPDSPSYLLGSEYRTPGYPLFLWTLLAVTGDARWIVPVQLNLLLLSFAVLGWSLGGLFRSRLVGLAVLLSLFGSTPLLFMSTQVMTEGLYAVCICLHLAAAAWLFRTSSPVGGLLAGCTAGLVVAVRPSGYAVVACLPVLVWCLRRHWRALVPAVAGGAAGVLLLIVLTQYVRHGLLATQSFGGFSLAGYVAPLITGDLPTKYPDVAGRLARRLAPLVRQLPAPSDPFAHAQASANLIGPMMYGQVIPEIQAYVGGNTPSLSPPLRWRQADDVAMTLALDGILNDPGWYVRHSVANYREMWNRLETDFGRFVEHVIVNQRETVALLRSVPGAQRFDPQWYAEPVVLDDHWLDDVWGSMPWWRPWAVRLIFAASLLALFGLLRAEALPARVQIVVYAAALLQVSLGLLALVVPGIYRFLVPLIPVMVVFAIGGIACAGEWAASLRDSRVRP